jgi:excisionase family DNA binding protein
MASDQLSLVLERLERIESTLCEHVQQKTAKYYYTTDEAAKVLRRSEYTVREWCRQGRIRAEKKGSGRGKYQSWVVSHAELLRFQREGLLPAKH